MTDPTQDHDLSEKLRDGIDTAKDKAAHVYESARETANQAVDTAKEKAGHVYESARETATHAVETSRDKAREAARQTAETIEGNPLSVLVGGLALGAIVAAILPRSQREKDVLAPVGAKLAAAATAAIAAAKDTGRSELANFGISRDAAKGQARSLVDNLLSAASSAGAAAAQAGKDQVKTAK